MSGSFEDALAVVDRPGKQERLNAESGSFWRKDPPILDDSGSIIQGGMWKHQRTWWELPNFIKVLVGGYGAGKTISASKRGVALALQNAPCPIALVSPTFPIARQTTILTTAELLEGKKSLLGRDFWWTYNSTTHEFKVRYHGREGHILIYSGDNPLSLRGPNLAAAIIDEPFIQDKQVFDQMIARIRHPQATHKELGLTGTPEQLNWGFDLCMGDLFENHDVGVVNASTRANLALDPSYTERLEGAFTSKAAEAYIEGEFRNLSEGMVYYAFEQEEHVARIERPYGSELGVGMDFNVNPMAAVAFWRDGDHIHVFKEYELPNADTEYMCSVLYEDHWKSGLRNIYPDATGRSRATNAPGGRSDFHYIKRAGFNIKCYTENPPRKDRYNAVNGKFRAKNGRITMTVSPDCKKLIKYLSIYSHEILNKQDDLSHLLDAFGYPIAHLFPVVKSTAKMGRLRGH